MRVVVLAAVVFALPVSPARAWDTRPFTKIVTKQHYLCGRNDLQEGAIQGDVPKADQDSGRAQRGYNCGLSLLGYVGLGKNGRPNNNANLAWAGHCAYISSAAGVSVVPQQAPTPPPGAGVAVVSVAANGLPTYVATLRNPGTVATSETLNAVTTPQGRSILVVGQYGNDAFSKPKPMDIYDVSNPDCSKFKHLGTYYWPANIHNLTISHDGRYVFATLPVQAVDISGLWDNDAKTGVVYLGNLEEAMGGPSFAVGPLVDIAGVVTSQLPSAAHPFGPDSHEAWPSADGKTLYIGGQTPMGDIFTIVDIRGWLARKGKPRIISQIASRGHSIRTAGIDGKPYVLHSDESVFDAAYGCLPQDATPFAGPAQPWLTDISDPAHPRTVVQFGLEINKPKFCAYQLDAKENDSVHYHDVDNPDDTTFVMASMWNAGIRIFDVRDPKEPVEVAYFNPGDVDPSPAVDLDHAWGHIRWLPQSGQLWFATADGGFWVARLESQVQHYLGLSSTTSRDAGAPGTRGVLMPRTAATVSTAAYYCALAPVTPRL